jgi:hypothetical protein
VTPSRTPSITPSTSSTTWGTCYRVYQCIGCGFSNQWYVYDSTCTAQPQGVLLDGQETFVCNNESCASPNSPPYESPGASLGFWICSETCTADNQCSNCTY